MRYDPETKKLVDEKPTNGEKRYVPTVKVNGERLDKLVAFCKADGISLTRKNKAGKIVPDDSKLANAIRLFANAAIDQFITDRETQ